MNSKSDPIRLGLIGNGIQRSRAGELHRAAAQLCGLDLTYELIDLEGASNDDFRPTLVRCQESGFVGVNVTHPYKELAAAHVSVADANIKRLGSVNTIRLNDTQKQSGHNTDYTGFLQVLSNELNPDALSRVAQLGCGGVGRSIAFALAEQGAQRLSLFDPDAERCLGLERSLTEHFPDTDVVSSRNVDIALQDAIGIVNCSPIGMYQYPGTPVATSLLAGKAWVFDAVYTPMETEFMRAAKAQDLLAISGFELFFYQGVHAFELFTGHAFEANELRALLLP